jgi:hypothetical protein
MTAYGADDQFTNPLPLKGDRFVAQALSPSCNKECCLAVIITMANVIKAMPQMVG